MGNCVTFRRVVAWMDDGEWDNIVESESPRHCTDQPPKFQEEDHPSTSAKEPDDLELFRPFAESSSAAEKSTKPTYEVRIKITKKQLAEMLKQADSKGLPTQDVLASLIDTAKPHRVRHRIISQCWRPGLQSIPEIVE